MQFPNNSIRGILNFDCLCKDRTFASLNLFAFQSERQRPDGWIEESINWEDNDSAIDFTLNQTNENEQPKFKVGIAILPRSELDKLKKRTGIKRVFCYERAPVDDNHYHGNLLLHHDIEKPLKTMIRSVLAIASKIVLRQDK